jgi:hypothetical protein
METKYYAINHLKTEENVEGLKLKTTKEIDRNIVKYT